MLQLPRPAPHWNGWQCFKDPATGWPVDDWPVFIAGLVYDRRPINDLFDRLEVSSKIIGWVRFSASPIPGR